MTAIGTPREQGEALHHGDPGLGTILYTDLRVRSLLLGEARKRVATRAFGVHRDDQSFLVTAILIGAGALIAFGLLSHSLRPAIAGTAREVRGLTRDLRAAFGARYAR
jgi:hypothetical protein